MFRNHLKIALRNLFRNKISSAINIGGLALGIACCLLIALYIYDELSYDRFNLHYNHIYRLTEKQKQSGGIFDVAVTPGPLAAALDNDFPEIAQTARVGRWGGLLTSGEKSQEAEQMLIVDSSFFSLFQFPLLLGNSKRIFGSPDEVIFSEAMAAKFFGDDWQQQHVLDRAILLNNDKTLKLVGVAKNPPTNSHLQFDVLLPFAYVDRYDEWGNKWNSNSYHTYLRLRTDAAGTPTDPLVFGEKIKHQLRKYDGGNESQLLLQPLGEIYLHSNFAFESDWGPRGDIFYVRILALVGLIVLIIAMVNFINLATARAAQRAKEVGVRKTVGAPRSSLIVQFLGEALLMTSIAVGLALLLAEILLPLFIILSGKTLQIPYQIPAFWLGLAAMTAVVSLVTGLYPAFFLSSFRPARVLKGAFQIKTGKGFRQSLVVGQFSLSIALITGTLVIYQQLNYLQHTKLGFDQSNLLYVQLKGDLRAKASLFKTQIAQVTGVASVSIATTDLVDEANSSNLEWEGMAPKDEILITHANVDVDFVPTTGMSMVSGRNFSAKILSDSSSLNTAYLINETAAKQMGWTVNSALGKSINFWGQKGNVIGVVKDFHFRPLRTSIEPFILRYRPLEFYFNLLVKTKPGAGSKTLAEISKVYKKLDPANPISYGFVNQDLNLQYKAEQRFGNIMLSFAILTIVVSCLGLFGLTVFMAEQRVKEIGVRKVLGASVANIMVLLAKDFILLVVIAIVIASPIAWYAMNLWLQNFAYHIDLQWWMFALTGGVALGIAFLTTSFQSVRAAMVNPVKSLRSE
jgi:putative ABC transport system permease protein